MVQSLSPTAPHGYAKSSRPLPSSSSPLSSESAASCATRRRSSRSSRVLAGPPRLMNGCSSSWCALQRYSKRPQRTPVARHSREACPLRPPQPETGRTSFGFIWRQHCKKLANSLLQDAAGVGGGPLAIRYRTRMGWRLA